VAAKAGRLQDEILKELCHGITAATQLDLVKAKHLIAKELAPLLEKAISQSHV
jgi:hypothetical protein